MVIVNSEWKQIDITGVIMDEGIKVIEEASGGCIGVTMGLLTARQALGEDGDACVKMFLSKVPERGEALWERFLNYRATHPNSDFIVFMSAALMPKRAD